MIVSKYNAPRLIRTFLVLCLHHSTVNSWNSISLAHRHNFRGHASNNGRIASALFQWDSASSTYDALPSDVAPSVDDSQTVANLKRNILALAAAYDRGFGATPSVRGKMDRLISQLSSYVALEDVTTGFDESQLVDGDSLPTSPPLNGTWQMIWTSAYDVLSLAATPLSTVSAIYQEINPSKQSAINIIDLIPRTQALIPPFLENIPTPVTRLKVQTRATRRGPQRVGLVFESVEIQPLKNLGLDWFPLSFKFDLPTKYLTEFLSSYDSPGFFDVTYVDNDMLIIQQNEPGGCFVSVKVPSADL